MSQQTVKVIEFNTSLDLTISVVFNRDIFFLISNSAVYVDAMAPFSTPAQASNPLRSRAYNDRLLSP